MTRVYAASRPVHELEASMGLQEPSSGLQDYFNRYFLDSTTVCTESEDQITPNRLCAPCLETVKVCTRAEFWTNDGERRCSRLPQLPHYDSFAQLKASALTGCHLCSLFLRDYRDLLDDDNSSYTDLAVRPSRLDFQSRNKCSLIVRLQLWDTKKNEKVGGIVEMHRHDEERKKFPKKCHERQQGSLELDYKWRTSTGSPAAFKILYHWLQQCESHHGTCRIGLSKTRPGRLLDLGAFKDSQSIRLVVESDVEAVKYAALSYRWGETNHFTLSSSNYDQMKSRIHLHDLPRTIREAIEICRQLAVRYFWVDALCIIQDDDQDIAEEIPKMSSIYAGALFTVAAADSDDSQGGCFRERSPLFVQNCSLSGPDGTEWVFGITSSCEHGNDLKSSALARRGWVLQEQLMAPRTIHFSSEEIIWECRELLCCQVCYASQKNLRVPLNPQASRKVLSIRFSEWEGLKPELLLFPDLWAELVEDYSRAQLSVIDDKLSALAGIAQLVHDNLHLKASHGIWLDFFVDGLLWSSYNRGGRIDELRTAIPSWSWVSMRGSVLMIPAWKKPGRFFVAKVTQHPPVTPFCPISLLRRQRVQPGSCKIRSWIMPYTLHTLEPNLTASESKGTTDGYPHLYSSTDEGNIDTTTPVFSNKRNVSSLDLEFDARTVRTQHLTCLLLKRSIDNTIIVDTGLILEQLHPATSQYRRVGYFQESIGERTRPQYRSWTCIDSDETVALDLEMEFAEDTVSQLLSSSVAHAESMENPLADECDDDGVYKISMAQLVPYLRLFNGTETEAEVEIF